jgi:hypothetical protein
MKEYEAGYNAMVENHKPHASDDKDRPERGSILTYNLTPIGALTNAIDAVVFSMESTEIENIKDNNAGFEDAKLLINQIKWYDQKVGRMANSREKEDLA